MVLVVVLSDVFLVHAEKLTTAILDANVAPTNLPTSPPDFSVQCHCRWTISLLSRGISIFTYFSLFSIHTMPLFGCRDVNNTMNIHGECYWGTLRIPWVPIPRSSSSSSFPSSNSCYILHLELQIQGFQQDQTKPNSIPAQSSN